MYHISNFYSYLWNKFYFTAWGTLHIFNCKLKWPKPSHRRPTLERLISTNQSERNSFFLNRDINYNGRKSLVNGEGLSDTHAQQLRRQPWCHGSRFFRKPSMFFNYLLLPLAFLLKMKTLLVVPVLPYFMKFFRLLKVDKNLEKRGLFLERDGIWSIAMQEELQKKKKKKNRKGRNTRTYKYTHTTKVLLFLRGIIPQWLLIKLPL